MKKIVLVTAIALQVLIPACAVFAPYSAPITTVDPKVCLALPEQAKPICKDAADTLLKGYATLAGHNGRIAQKKEAGIYTREQAQGYLDQSIAARKELDKAKGAFLSGDYNGALSSANLTNLAINALEKELTKQAAKGAQ